MLVLLNAKKGEVAQAKKDLENDPVYSLFSKEKNEELENIVKNIFQGRANFFNWKKKGEEESGEEKPSKFLGISSETAKLAGKGILLIAGLVFICYLFKKFTE